jgi:AmiR/NasT family two-component response regulator
VVTKPIHPFGVLATLVTARAANRHEHRLAQKLRKLEENLRSRREIEKGIRILMTMQGISEDAAYRLIQQRAMELRQSVAAVAVSILHAHALFAEPKVGREGRPLSTVKAGTD